MSVLLRNSDACVCVCHDTNPPEDTRVRLLLRSSLIFMTSVPPQDGRRWRPWAVRFLQSDALDTTPDILRTASDRPYFTPVSVCVCVCVWWQTEVTNDSVCFASLADCECDRDFQPRLNDEQFSDQPQWQTDVMCLVMLISVTESPNTRRSATYRSKTIRMENSTLDWSTHNHFFHNHNHNQCSPDPRCIQVNGSSSRAADLRSASARPPSH